MDTLDKQQLEDEFKMNYAKKLEDQFKAFQTTINELKIKAQELIDDASDLHLEDDYFQQLNDTIYELTYDLEQHGWGYSSIGC